MNPQGGTDEGSREGVEGWRRPRSERRQHGRALQTHGKVRYEGGGGNGGDGGRLGEGRQRYGALVR